MAYVYSSMQHNGDVSPESYNCLTWQSIAYNLPEDDTILSKHVGV